MKLWQVSIPFILISLIIDCWINAVKIRLEDYNFKETKYVQRLLRMQCSRLQRIKQKTHKNHAKKPIISWLLILFSLLFASFSIVDMTLVKVYWLLFFCARHILPSSHSHWITVVSCFLLSLGTRYLLKLYGISFPYTRWASSFQTNCTKLIVQPQKTFKKISNSVSFISCNENLNFTLSISISSSSVLLVLLKISISRLSRIAINHIGPS